MVTPFGWRPLPKKASLAGCLDSDVEQHLYSAISTPEPNNDKIISCIDHIYQSINKRHPLDTRRTELFKLMQEPGESMVAYSNRILYLADECELNEITQHEIMGSFSSIRFRLESKERASHGNS